jgi:hypothetical protein
MIEDYFNELNKEVSNKSLTADERSSIRSVLAAEMSKAPLGKIESYVESTMWYLSMMDYKRIVAAVTVSALLFTMGGVSYAAEQALPGDKLYVVKTDFNEAVVELLAVSNKDKARVHTELAEKRLQEASTLAEQERLDDNNKEIISKKLREHVSSVKEDLVDIVDKKDYVSAVEVSTEFEATLKAHSEVLVALVDKKDAEAVEAANIANGEASSTDDLPEGDNGDVQPKAMAMMAIEGTTTASVDQQFVSDVLVEVNNSIAEIAEVRAQAQDAVTDSVLVSQQTLAEEKRAELADVTTAIQRRLSSSSSTVSLDVVASASSTMASVAEAVVTGDAQMAEGKFNAAYRTFNTALLAAREAIEKLEVLENLETTVVVGTPLVGEIVQVDTGIEATTTDDISGETNGSIQTDTVIDVGEIATSTATSTMEVVDVSITSTTTLQIELPKQR